MSTPDHLSAFLLIFSRNGELTTLNLLNDRAGHSTPKRRKRRIPDLNNGGQPVTLQR